MKKILFSLLALQFATCVFAQQQTFDLVTYTPPKGWKKQSTENAIQFSIEDATKGAYCLITLYKAVPGTDNSKENFDMAWTSIVKEMVTVSTVPEMQAVTTENGWETQSGFAPFESDGTNGLVLLVSASAVDKMINLIILTNTEEYEKEMTAFLESITLKNPTVSIVNQTNKPVTTSVKSQQITPNAKSSGFAFTTTNFDDGWTSTVQNDWVEVTKSNTKVLIHYPNKQADAYNSIVMDGLKNAWNILIAPRYSSASNFEFKPVTGWQAIEFAEADMVEKITAKTVHVVLFKMNYSNGSGRYLEFITPDKKVFEQIFGPYHQTTSGWENMEKMADYNKFAVAASDLRGKWTSDFSGAIQYVNSSTGFDSHMDTHASAENFIIGNNNTYNWEISVASGAVGNIKFQSKKSNGKFSMNGSWKINFSSIEGKARSYDTYFTCIKGLRILWLDGRPFAKAQ